ncbi:MAG: HDIG domain-containing protein [Spirochaetales bacterium]|nr:HDIG domain-containing protein [Spirochaetales bacterium]
MAEIVRQDAWELLNKHVKKEALIRHALSVEGVMRYFARQFGEDEEEWGVIGLCHDIDYEKHPEEHLGYAGEMLRDAGWPENYIKAVLSHGWGICSEVKPETRLEKTLFTIDELTGLITASALVRPSKSILDIKVKSVKKKWNVKAFSAGVNREIIEKGAAMMEMEIPEIIEWSIQGMRTVAEAIGLKGTIV